MKDLSNEQLLINTLYQLTLTIHENEWFGKRIYPRDRDEVQEWVSKTLSVTNDIHTIPCGSSWECITTKEEFDRYWKENSKLKEK